MQTGTDTDTSPADSAREPMTLTEGSRWAFLVLVIVASAIYGFTVLPQLATTDAADIGWQIPMIWAIGIQVVGTIVLSIVIAIVNGIVTRRQPEDADVRDKQIERYGDRIAQGIMAFGSAGVLVLTMLELDWFWIGNALYLAGAVGAVIGAIASIRAYHGVFRG
jgi:hypothetical protein